MESNANIHITIQTEEQYQDAVRRDDVLAGLISVLQSFNIPVYDCNGEYRHPFEIKRDIDNWRLKTAQTAQSTCRKYDYEDCLRFIEKAGIQLYDYQKQMLRMMCENKTFISARGCGRTTVAEAFGKYVAHTQDRNDYNIVSEQSFPATLAIRNNLLSNEWVEKLRQTMSPPQFKKEYLCEWDK